MTPAEAVPWRALRDRRLAGLEFRRQHPVGPFALDFCCPVLRLAVEVDGAVHDAKTDQDSARTELLEANGYQVLRFRNDEVLTSLPSVLARIHHAASVLAQKGARSSPTHEVESLPSPDRGRGVGGEGLFGRGAGGEGQ